MTTKNFPKYAPAILRYGVSLVYLWFGAQQFLHTQQWISFIPKFIIDNSPVDASTLVHLNGAVELVFGTALIIGFFSRTSATVLALHMAHITTIVGYDAIGVRDFGIVIATTASAFYGADILCLESYLTFRRASIGLDNIVDDTQPVTRYTVQSQYAPSTQSAAKFDQMVAYIQKEQTKGTATNTIRDSLFMSGWKSADIDKAYLLVSPPPIDPTNTNPPTDSAPIA